MMDCEPMLLHENGWVPNNERLPVLLCRHVVEGEGEGDDAASRFEALFASHGWPPQWRDTIYDFHHYHSTAHEALGIAQGWALLVIGGPDGCEIRVGPGDALVLPVGTGHRRVVGSDDFMVVGAYPQGQVWDVCREAPSDEMRTRMRDFPVPEQDPLEGRAGLLLRAWR